MQLDFCQLSTLWKKYMDRSRWIEWIVIAIEYKKILYCYIVTFYRSFWPNYFFHFFIFILLFQSIFSLPILSRFTRDHSGLVHVIDKFCQFIWKIFVIFFYVDCNYVGGYNALNLKSILNNNGAVTEKYSNFPS